MTTPIKVCPRMCHKTRVQSVRGPIKDKAQALRLQPASKVSDAHMCPGKGHPCKMHSQDRGLTFQGLLLRTGVCMLNLCQPTCA